MTGDGSFERPLGLLAVTLVSLFIPGTLSESEMACEVPLSLRGTWYRTDTKAQLTFNATGVLGSVPEAGSGFFTCDSTLEFRYVFSVHNATASSYFCWKLARSTDQSWLLYSLTPGQNEDKGVVERQRGDPVPSLNEVCSLNQADVLPTLLYKWPFDVTKIASSEHQCPDDVLASFDYVKDGTGCSNSDSELNFCRDLNFAYINYTACGEKILFSQNGVLSCTASFDYQSSTYVMLVNHDSSFDETHYRRFVCMKVTKHENGQSATVYPTDCSATSGTHQLALYITRTCVPEVDSGANLMVIIIGVVVAVNVVALTLVFVCIFLKVRSEKNKKKKAYMANPDNDGTRTVDKGPYPPLPAILPPLEGEEKKASPRYDVNANGQVTAEKADDLEITHM